MKNICFIGAFEKWDLILYVSKIIKGLGKTVMVIDATELQKARYIVPTMSPTKSYITRFEDVDIAIGFENYKQIERYIEEVEGHNVKYDYILVNVDNQQVFSNFNNSNTIKNYFVTSFDLYSIRKGLETIKNITKPIPITKILFSREINEEDDYYLDYLALGYKIIWEENKINFPYNTQDIEVMIENQKVFKIRTKGLSQQYKESLEYILRDIIKDVNIINLRRVMKNIEREG